MNAGYTYIVYCFCLYTIYIHIDSFSTQDKKRVMNKSISDGCSTSSIFDFTLILITFPPLCFWHWKNLQEKWFFYFCFLSLNNGIVFYFYRNFSFPRFLFCTHDKNDRKTLNRYCAWELNFNSIVTILTKEINRWQKKKNTYTQNAVVQVEQT